MTWTRSPYIDLPGPGSPEPSTLNPEHSTLNTQPSGDIFAEKSRAAWGSSQAPEPRCDFSPGHVACPTVTSSVRALTLWRRSLYGLTLSEMKARPEMPGFFARNMAPLIRAFLGPSLSPFEFAVVSPPKRRHPGRENFASRMCALIAQELSLPYIDDFAICHSRKRVDAEFSLGIPPERMPRQRNIIVIDDILTTGSTLMAMHSLILSTGRNPILLCAVLNRK